MTKKDYVKWCRMTKKEGEKMSRDEDLHKAKCCAINTDTASNFFKLGNAMINLTEVESFREEFHSRNNGVNYAIVVVTYKSGRIFMCETDLNSVHRDLSAISARL